MRRHVRITVRGGLCAMAISCSDPVHDQLVQALGPEDPAVPPGPSHRPGQPCLACHGGMGPATTEFSAGGTVYMTEGRNAPADQALVQIEDIDGRVVKAPTSSVGNFFVAPSQIQFHYPILMRVMSSDGRQTEQMFSVSNRSGSCADCHFLPPGPNSPGPVFLFPNLNLGGDAGM
jgi:hypothetical protein